MAEPTAQEALIHLMVVMSAADRDMTDSELARIGSVIRLMPVFAGFDEERTIAVARQCQERLQAPDGLDGILSSVAAAVPPDLYDTAYALAVEVASADLHMEREELRMLQIVRARLNVDPLSAAAIEHAARARHRTLA
ncbi:tellurite resistance TerB family protein [Aquibium sp. A9E412]|uniref:tellurite resistance TerB family protein n=1 Tax=Aquibium sp. A9E412 TaxID=2976767 RepID=UPI0025AF963D|nr:tellurite resistance TerB family protein [Aquibium sp. A9E412]MDN2568556.1 tellurite resistance TerB family protein [Aquibium sp. A9E412]